MIKNRLRLLLAERDLTYTRLNELTGISISALSELGSGATTKVSFETLDKICATLECQVGDLFVWEPEGKRTKRK